MQNEISLLETDKGEREEHYKRERRRTLDFEDEVFHNEETFNKELKEKLEKISKLSETLAELHSKNQILEDNIQGYIAEMKVFQERIDEFYKTNTEMREKIYLFEKENIELKNKMADLCRNISTRDKMATLQKKTKSEILRRPLLEKPKKLVIKS